MKNVEKADKIHLGSLIENLKKGYYVIPDFQRDFEWEPWDVVDLIKSIFSDFYIGTLLLWKGSKSNYRMLSCQPLYGYDGKGDPQHIILDGQQRLTAIYFAFFQPNKIYPRRAKQVIFFLNIDKFLNEGQDKEKAIWYDSLKRKNKNLLENRELQYEQHIFPLGIIKEGTWGTSEWLKDYRDYWLNKVENEDNEENKIIYKNYSEYAKQFKDFIEELLNQYHISYIELDKDIEIDKVCEIFTKINSKGIPLDIFDLLNAMLRPKEIHLKELWQENENELDFTDSKKMKIYILQVMSILEQTYCSSKYLYYMVPEVEKTIKKPDGSKEQIILIKNKDEFLIKWKRSVQALKKAIKNLKNFRDYGAIKPNYVPYPSIIPAFASIKSYVEDKKYPNILDIQLKIRKWYWASIFTNRYSSSVETTTARDFQDLKRWFENDGEEPDLIDEFINKYRNIDLINDNPKGSSIYNAIFNLLIINEARDWATFDLPEYDTLDDHHIVPLSIFGKIAGSSINSILNRTPLTKNTNRVIINNRMPNVYLKEMFEKNNNEEKIYEILKSHLISRKAVNILLRDPFTKQDFEEFIIERQETIRNAIEDILINEKIDLPQSLYIINKKIEEIEIKIRSLIIFNTGSSYEYYFNTVPSHIKEKVQIKINKEIRKNPGVNLEYYKKFDKLLHYFDMMEYFDYMVVKENWPLYEKYFNTKEQLQMRFNQLCNLRNGIRHAREVSEIDKKDGEAAILWFNQIFFNINLKKNEDD